MYNQLLPAYEAKKNAMISKKKRVETLNRAFYECPNRMMYAELKQAMSAYKIAILVANSTVKDLLTEIEYDFKQQVERFKTVSTVAQEKMEKEGIWGCVLNDLCDEFVRVEDTENDVGEFFDKLNGDDF